MTENPAGGPPPTLFMSVCRFTVEDTIGRFRRTYINAHTWLPLTVALSNVVHPKWAQTENAAPSSRIDGQIFPVHMR